MDADFDELLRTRRLVAIVRGTDPASALAAIVALVEEGVQLIEISLTTPGAGEVLRRARAEIGEHALVGAGTVLSSAQASEVAQAGADFVVTPAHGPGSAAAIARAIPAVVGALTPTEIAAAERAGAAAVKLFPASVGGPTYLAALRDPFPTTDFVPVGGVDERLATEYLALGAVAVGVGSPLLGDAARGGSLSGLRERARRFLDTVGGGP